MASLDDLSPRLWPDYLASIVSVLRAALESFHTDRHDQDFQDMNELELNRQLYFRIQRQIYRRKREPNSAPGMPALDAKSVPSPDDPERVPRENKVPDLQWSVVDDQIDDPDRSLRSYVVECKRLGRSQRADWPFNVNYVQHGAVRFVAETHLYGKDDAEGGMVGYIQSMDLTDIWDDVHAHMARAGLPPIPFPQSSSEISPVAIASHNLTRNAGRSPFRLQHFWIDMRR